MAKDGSRAAPKNIRKPLAAQGMDSPVQPKLSVTRLWARRLLVRVDELSMPSGLLLGAGIAGVCGYGLLHAGPQWGLGGAVLLLGTACTLALTGDAVAEPLPKPDQEPIPTPAPAKPKSLSEPLDMIELPSGEFWMGSPESEPGRSADEVRHRVGVSAFAVAKYPVTQKLYQEIMEQNLSHYKGESLPVESVSWFDAVRFCNRLSEKAGRVPCYRIVDPKQETSTHGAEYHSDHQPVVSWDQAADGYRLPTEAEWEYACRAGTETAYGFGDDPAQLGEYAWFDGNSESRTHEVGTKKANMWGLHDLHGNVWEWCWDQYADYTVITDNDKSASLIGPIDVPHGRVLRGGSFAGMSRVVRLPPRLGGGPRELRSARRVGQWPEDRLQDGGFLCVRSSGRQR
jgi:formylglycine-generating enzyme required for sulfatase activity